MPKKVYWTLVAHPSLAHTIKITISTDMNEVRKSYYDTFNKYPTEYEFEAARSKLKIYGYKTEKLAQNAKWEDSTFGDDSGRIY